MESTRSEQDRQAQAGKPAYVLFSRLETAYELVAIIMRIVSPHRFPKNLHVQIENGGREGRNRLCHRSVVPSMGSKSPLCLFCTLHQMKTNTITKLGLVTLLAMPAAAEDTNLLKDINQFGSEWGDDTALVPSDSLAKTIAKAHETAYEKYGLEWVVETSYLYSSLSRAGQGSSSDQQWYLLHAQANWNISKKTNTWIRAEFSLSTAMNGHTWHNNNSFEDDTFGSALLSRTALNSDVFYKNGFFIPEFALMQYFNNEKSCIIAGVINQTNYFDANAYANSSFANFTNSGFVNAAVLPLMDSNFGFVLQNQFNDNWYGMLSYSLAGQAGGTRYSPWHEGADDGYVMVAELGYVHDKGAIRLTPFMMQANDGEKDRTYGGVNLGFDQELTEHLAAFGRIGINSDEHGYGTDASFAASAGLIVKQALSLLGFKESENNFFGIAFSVNRPTADKGEEASTNAEAGKREMVLELGYSYYVTPYFYVRPNWQYIYNPADSDKSAGSAFGAQAVLTF